MVGTVAVLEGDRERAATHWLIFNMFTGDPAN